METPQLQLVRIDIATLNHCSRIQHRDIGDHRAIQLPCVGTPHDSQPLMVLHRLGHSKSSNQMDLY